MSTKPGLHTLGAVTVLTLRVLQQVVHNLNHLSPPLAVLGPGLAKGPPGRPLHTATLVLGPNKAQALNTSQTRAGVQ